MFALTLRQPWATFVSMGWKPIENRDWAPRVLRTGDLLCIHAASARMTQQDFFSALQVAERAHSIHPLKDFTPDGDFWLGAIWDMCLMHSGRILCRVSYHGYLRPGEPPLSHVPIGMRAGISRMLPWWERGSKGWILSDVSPFVQPPKAKGRQGLWRVPDDLGCG